LAKDEKLKKVLGALEWFVHETPLPRLPVLSVYHGYIFPSELGDEYYEPRNKLRHLNLSVNNTKLKMRQVLHDYFDKKPAG
jgi:hypothetical protein